MLRIFRVFRVMGAVTAWSEKAMVDGVIDSKEAGELVEVVASTLGFSVKLKPEDPSD